MASIVKLLLKESVRHVGKVGDVVEVSAGYARNYLLPNQLAVEPTAGNIKKLEARRQEIERQEREKRSQQRAPETEAPATVGAPMATEPSLSMSSTLSNTRAAPSSPAKRCV